MHYIQATLLSGIVIGYLSIGLVGSNPAPITVPNDGNNKSQISDGPTVAGSDSDNELSLLFLIHRHGDRAPLTFPPKDPYRPLANEIWPTGLGMLTNSGKERMFRLGKYLRRRYADYLGTSNPRQVYTKSSDVDRCIASAQLVLAGLYPPVGKSVWNEELPWQPVAVHTRPQHDDPMLNVESYCPTRQTEYDREFTSEDNRNKLFDSMDGAKPLIEKIKLEYGFNFDTMYEYYDITSTLNIERENNLALPKWLSGSMDKLNKIAYNSELTWTKTDLMKRLYAGVIINDIVERMNEYRRQRDGDIDLEKGKSYPVKNKPWKNNYKLFHYSTHDTNIHSILNTLGVYQGQVLELPNFGSTILIEMHRSKKRPDYSVKLFYLGETKDEDKSLKELTLTNCLEEGDTACSLDMFAKYTRPYRLNPNDWFLECNKIPDVNVTNL